MGGDRCGFGDRIVGITLSILQLGDPATRCVGISGLLRVIQKIGGWSSLQVLQLDADSVAMHCNPAHDRESCFP